MLTNADKRAARAAMLSGNVFTRGNVWMFRAGPQKYCVQRVNGVVSERDVIIAQGWDEALEVFEALGK